MQFYDSPGVIGTNPWEAEVEVEDTNELRSSQINFEKFKWNFGDIKRIIKIIEGFIEIDDKDIGPSHIYSLIMRIRVLHMMDSLLSKQAFSNKSIENLLVDLLALQLQLLQHF